MRHFSMWMCGVLAAAVALGCGPGKELPTEVPKQPSTGRTAADLNGAVPATSDPAAKAIVERAVKAITEDMPERLAKAKVSRVSAQGTISLLNPIPDEASRLVEAVWPDRAQVTYKFNALLSPNRTLRLRSPLGWMTVGPQRGNTNPSELGPIVSTDVTAQHWLPLGLPLADSRAIVFDPQKAPAGSATGMVVKIGLHEFPIYAVTFEERSGLPVRIEYQPVEFGRRLSKSVVLSEHKPTQGFVLPTRMECSLGGKVVERWTLENWEFPEKIDDGLFEEPK